MFLYATSSHVQRYNTFHCPLYRVLEGQASQTPTTSHFNRRVRQYSPTGEHNNIFHFLIWRFTFQVRRTERVYSNQCKIIYTQLSFWCPLNVPLHRLHCPCLLQICSLLWRSGIGLAAKSLEDSKRLGLLIASPEVSRTPQPISPPPLSHLYGMSKTASTATKKPLRLGQLPSQHWHLQTFWQTRPYVIIIQSAQMTSTLK